MCCAMSRLDPLTPIKTQAREFAGQKPITIMPRPRKDTTPTPEERFVKIVQALSRYSGVTPPADTAQSRKKFGSSALKIHDKIFAMISSKGEFVVKLPQQRVDALISSGQGKRFDPGHGRLMKEWLTVEKTSGEVWLRLAKEAMEFVASRPAPKKARKVSHVR